MNNPYVRIALLYLQRYLFWLVVLFMLLQTLIGVNFGGGRSTNLPSFLFLFGVAYYAGFVGAQLRVQFARPQAGLVPNYRGPHLVVAGIMLLVPITPVMLFVCEMADLSLFGVSAVMTAIIAAVLWITSGAWLVSVLVATPIMLTMYTTLGREWLASLEQGQNPIEAAALMLCGIALIVVLIFQYLNLNEELPAYRMRQMTGYAWAWGRGSRREIQTYSYASTPDWWIFLFGGGWKLNRLQVSASTNLWARAQLWRIGVGPVRPWLMPLVLLCFYAVLGLAFHQIFLAIFVMVSPVFAVLAIQMPTMMWMQRASSLAGETIRPTERSRFIREIGLAFALDIAEGTFLSWLSFLLLLAIFQPETLMPWLALLSLAVAVGISVAGYALVVWLTTFRSRLLPKIALFMAFMVVIQISTVGPAFFRWWPEALAYLYGILAAIFIGSGWLIHHAYRRWCVIDLD